MPGCVAPVEFFKVGQDPGRGLDTHICADQLRFQFFEQRFIDARSCLEQVRVTAQQTAAGLLQSVRQSLK